jgi:hypothetical protein
MGAWTFGMGKHDHGWAVTIKRYFGCHWPLRRRRTYSPIGVLVSEEKDKAPDDESQPEQTNRNSNGQNSCHYFDGLERSNHHAIGIRKTLAQDFGARKLCGFGNRQKLPVMTGTDSEISFHERLVSHSRGKFVRCPILPCARQKGYLFH